MIEIGHISHPGNTRHLNEDSYDIDLPNRLAVLVDGMGGSNAGDIASAFVREHVRNSLLQSNDLTAALKNAGQALRIQRPQQGITPRGASALAVNWDDDAYHIAWIGACRAFFYNGQHTQHLSTAATDAAADKNAVQGLANVQALGVTTTEKLQIQSASGAWRRNQSLLLCSDGLMDECDAALIHDCIGNKKLSAQEVVEQLLRHALQGKENNNITVILLRLS